MNTELLNKKAKEFTLNGHKYNVVPIDGSEDYSIIRDNRKVRRVKKEIADKAIEYVDKLFK